MTRNDLEQVFCLKRELQMWQMRLAELQADIALSPKVVDGMPFQHTNDVSNPTESKGIKLVETAKVIEGKIAEIQLRVAEIEEFILTIEDSILRQILEYHCCMLKGWDDVADAMKGGMTSDNARQIYHRFVSNLEQIN